MKYAVSTIAAWILAPALVIAGASWVAWRSADKAALDALRQRGAAALQLQAEALDGWLARYRALPSLYAQDPEVAGFLTGERDAAAIDHMNRKMVEWNALSGAADTYLLDERGVSLAASNWAENWSFVGNDYSFRPYFRQAAAGGMGRYYALGTQSNRRGYYFSHPVRAGGRRDGAVLGVMVVKASVESVEDDLRSSEGEAFVSDQHGVIILAGRPEWRLKSLGPLPESAQATIRRNRQFGAGPVLPASFDGRTPSEGAPPRLSPIGARGGGAAEEMLHLDLGVVAEDWRLHLLVPAAGAREHAFVAAALVGALTLAATLAAFILVQWRRRFIETLRAREQAGRRLERAVEERTADLRRSNTLLAQEVEERRLAEDRLRETQSELVQAAKLAALGQMAASLSHEYNQPLAAIRAYADNASSFLALERAEEAADNLSRISALTRRMAELSKNLTSFARKPKDVVEPVALAPIFDRATELLRGLLERGGVAVAVDCPPGIAVMGGETSLQQVMVNLIGNAAAASAQARRPAIAIRATRLGDLVEFAICDNGPGVPQGLREQIFDPFFTTKDPGEGLGLGLSITYNIVKDFGGSITVDNAPEGGARFRVRLKAADIPALAEATT